MKKIGGKQIRDQIAQMIRYQILSGVIKPGEELTQENIMEQLGLSRMPIREALQSLEQEGFLVRLSNRHMQVPMLAVEGVSHIFRAIVVMATELFVLTPVNQGELLCTRTQELARAGDNVGELAFHQLLISHLGNRYLAKAYQQFLDGYVSYVILHLKENGQESVQILNELVSAIGHGEDEKTAQATQCYFLMLVEVMRRHMKDWESAEA